MAQVYVLMRVFKQELSWQAIHRVILGRKVNEVAAGRYSARTGKCKDLNLLLDKQLSSKRYCDQRGKC